MDAHSDELAHTVRSAMATGDLESVGTMIAEVATGRSGVRPAALRLGVPHSTGGCGHTNHADINAAENIAQKLSTGPSPGFAVATRL